MCIFIYILYRMLRLEVGIIQHMREERDIPMLYVYTYSILLQQQAYIHAWRVYVEINHYQVLKYH